MDRRSFLLAAGGGLVGVAGCGGTSSSDAMATRTPDSTSTAAPTASAPAETTTPLPTRIPPERRYQPQMLDVELVSTWSAAGDLADNRIEGVGRGQPAVVAFRYRIRVPEGTINLKEGVDVLRDGELVVRRFRDVDRHVDAAGLHTWEGAMTFATGDWPTGELTATVAVGELQLHRTSESVSTAFELTPG